MSDLLFNLRSLARYEHADLSIADEAAAEIERLRGVIELAYGLLWHDRDTAARKALLATLDKAGQARGITAARKTGNGQEGDMPKAVGDALKYLRDYEAMTNAYAHNEDEAEIETIKIRAAALMLRLWAEGD